MSNLLLEILAEEVLQGNKPSNTYKPESFSRVAQVITEKYGVECKEDNVRFFL